MKATIDFPLVSTAYTGEFGKVEPLVAGVARSLWATSGSALAEELLSDRALGLQLMLKATANITSVRQSDPSKIRNLRSYLFRCYKNLILAEMEKEITRRRILERHFMPAKRSVLLSEEELNQRILINQIRKEMNDWTRTVFDLHQLGYTFEEIAPRIGAAANVIRSKYSKEISRLSRSINSRIKKYDLNGPSC